jgi:polyphosphate glucokinase
MHALGIDIGGTGIKGAVVDTATGQLVTERERIRTPRPAKPEPVADVVGQITRHFEWTGTIGVTFPGVVKGGTIHTAANLHKAWIGLDSASTFAKATGCGDVHVINDADAAGVAEVRFGHPEACHGVVILLTLGTGIGSAFLMDGVLVPNSELGHLKLGPQQIEAERRASELVREHEDLTWKKWAKRLTEYLVTLEELLWPDLFLIGGGASAQADRFVPLLECRTPVEPAQLLNQAGIVGAALLAAGETAPVPHDAPGSAAPPA